MICITGGSGFIGSDLCHRFRQANQEFQILDRRNSRLFPDEFIECDICDLTRLRETLYGNTIIHLAAEHRDDVRPLSRYHDVNVTGTKNVAQVAIEKGINRIVFTSTVAVYGLAAPDTSEEGDIQPFNDYGKTKYQAEEILRSWQAEAPEERSLIIIRPTVVFGPGNRGNVYNLLALINSGNFVMIGNGRNRKSMAFVRNLSAFIHFSAELGPGMHLHNYVDEPDLTMNELVELSRWTLKRKRGVGYRVPCWFGIAFGYVVDMAALITKRKFSISSIRVRKFCSDTCFRSSAHSLIGFSAETSIRDAIDLTLRAEFISPDSTAPVYFTE